MQQLAKRLSQKEELRARVRDALRVGVHWSTEVARRQVSQDCDVPLPHRVCQVCQLDYIEFPASSYLNVFAGVLLGSPSKL